MFGQGVPENQVSSPGSPSRRLLCEGSECERRDRRLELILANVDDVAEGAVAVAYPGRREHVHAALEEAFVDAGEPTERVVSLDEHGVVGPFELDLGGMSLGAEEHRVIGKDGKLGPVIAVRDGREREEVDATLGEARQR